VAARGEQRDVVFFGELGHQGVGTLAAHQHDAFHVHHARCPDNLGIAKAGQKHRLVLDEGQNVAHHVGGAGKVDLGVHIPRGNYNLGIQNIFYRRNFHINSYFLNYSTKPALKQHRTAPKRGGYKRKKQKSKNKIWKRKSDLVLDFFATRPTNAIYKEAKRGPTSETTHPRLYERKIL